MEKEFWKLPKIVFTAENYSFTLWDLYCGFAASFTFQTSYRLQVLSVSTYCQGSVAPEVSWPKQTP